MEKSDDASYNDSLVKKLDLEYSKVDEFDTYNDTKNDKNSNKLKKKSKFSLFKKQETTSSFNKTRVTNNRHIYNSQASHYTSSLQRHHHNSKTRLDGLDKLKKSISFTKSHEDASFSASSYSNNSSGKEQLEPLVLNNYSSLVNSNGLLTTAISLNNNKNKNGSKKHSSKTSSSQSPSPSPTSPSSSVNSLNESPSNKMIGFYNSKTNISKNKTNFSNGNNNNNTSNVGANSFKRGGVVQKPIGFLNSNVSNVNGSEKSTLINNSITTLNTNNITNTTVTTTASSSSSTSSGMCINDLKSIIIYEGKLNKANL